MEAKMIDRLDSPPDKRIVCAHCNIRVEIAHPVLKFRYVPSIGWVCIDCLNNTLVDDPGDEPYVRPEVLHGLRAVLDDRREVVLKRTVL